ncbi:MAG: phosphoribosylaminoimidazolesuccinocarboxamide synthase [Opitutales bacterium]|jgi:phosphoribosylaminoimidazole-succinocarboxamide synthase|nr:phosphoribosylaminoimidazolesuccinocarboxamide synthase [Opitutales bacterium]MDP4778193.1 phosphoribosylaminoimidazolesuccinocarboxamide synthase [Opitutales bacterium]MDP4883656.1 phosphoribosylaminoimidazolesuccinocarboxamide synthase [Opitutales bacterium]MDP5079087.1 phosphoribosylaminoimidazolesuccinocarboxamide synthase [Opitutales bacterium]
MTSETLPFPLPEKPLLKVDNLPYPLIASGKVREVYDMGDALLMVATDRVSAFDVIMTEGLAGKGVLLTQISLYWFERAAALTQHHLVDDHAARIVELGKTHPGLEHRSMIVKKLKPLPIEAVVRGYLSGSGWKAYQQTGQLFEYTLPNDLQDSSQLPQPVFTPTTKVASGHDMPIDCADAAKLIGEELFKKVHDLSIALYNMGVERADAADLILADTKFEFGTDEAGDLYLIDEILTPDSSRYWPREGYAPGGAQPSFDKQFVRDYLESLDWDKTPPPPSLPGDVLKGTLDRYIQAYLTIVNG